MICNLETSKDKLVQIVLVGQPEFEDELNLDRLRQLKQRLAVRSTILPLTKEESLEYIKFRLQKAGAPSASVFTTPALKEIIKKAQGIPRVLNVLCDNALITGFGYQKKPVTKRIVEEIIRDLDGKGRPRLVQRQLPRVVALAILILFFGITWFLPFKRVLFDQTAMSMSREQIEEDDAIRQVRPAAYAAAKDDRVREAPASGEPRGAAPQRNEPVVVTKTVTWGDTLWQLVRGVYGFARNAPSAEDASRPRQAE
jgi:general secretion pathway protein A